MEYNEPLAAAAKQHLDIIFNLPEVVNGIPRKETIITFVETYSCWYANLIANAVPEVITEIESGGIAINFTLLKAVLKPMGLSLSDLAIKSIKQ